MNFAQMNHLPVNWHPNGAEPPNSQAISNSNKIYEILKLEPVSMLPSVEGGIMIRYEAGQFGAFVECYNDGDIGYTLTYEGKSTKSVDLVHERISSIDALADILAHLGK